MFVNCFGLGTVGGDLTRGLLIAQGDNPKSTAVASVIADRLHGLAVLALIGSCSVLIFGRHNSMDPILVWSLFAVGPSIIIAWALAPLTLRRFFSETSVVGKQLDQVLKAFPRDVKALTGITLVAVTFHLWQLGLHWLMGRAVGVTIPWEMILVFIPFVNIVSTLPISWNGLGVRENAYIFFLSPAILSAEQAVAFGAIWIVAVTIASSVGGIISVVTRDFDLVKAKAAREREEGVLLKAER